MDILIPEALLVGLAAGLLLRKAIGYLTIPVVGLGMGVFWAARHAGDISSGTADIFDNAAPELIADTALKFGLAAVQAALASWAAIASLNYLVARAANRRALRAIKPPDRETPRRRV